MKKILTITTLLISNFVFCQLKGVIIDKETNEKIPYVNIWIENENIGTTSDENGEFVIDNSKGEVLILSSLGYETLKIDLKKLPNKIFLIPKTQELDEVTISTKKENKKVKIGTFDDSEVRLYYASDNSPIIRARLFNYDSLYNKTPYIKILKLRTYSEIRNAKFNIRLYSVGENGQPDKPIVEKNIIGITKKGTKNVEVDLSDLDVYFPKNGIFVSYEWLIIEENAFHTSIPIQDSEKRVEKILYEPKVGVLPTNHNTNSWIYQNGKWQKVEKIRRSNSKQYQDNYGILAIELTLTN